MAIVLTVSKGSFPVVQTKEISSHAHPAMRSRACWSGIEQEGYCLERLVSIGFPANCALKWPAFPEASLRQR